MSWWTRAWWQVPPQLFVLSTRPVPRSGIRPEEPACTSPPRSCLPAGPLKHRKLKKKKRHGGLSHKATLHIVSYSKRFFCAGWLNQKVVKKRVVGLSVTLKNCNCSQSGALCFPTLPEYLVCCSNQLWAEWVNIYRLPSMDVNNNPLTPAENLTFL